MMYNVMMTERMSSQRMELVANEEAASFRLPHDWRDGREPREAYAIDSRHTKDVDDAISYSEGTLRVSIADVASFLPPDSHAARLAKVRLYSKYTAEQVAEPMLPRELSEDIFSLQDCNERPAVTLHIPVDDAGQRGPLSITRDAIFTRRLTYTETDAAVSDMDRGVTSAHLSELSHLAVRLNMVRREQTGGREGIVFEDEEGHQRLQRIGAGIGQLIVQEAMIAASASVAEYAWDHQIASFIYRNHAILEDLLPDVTDPVWRHKLLAALSPGLYSLQPEGHMALKLPMYAPITSPLRRFVDLANQAALLATVDESVRTYDQRQVDVAINRLNLKATKRVEGHHIDQATLNKKISYKRKAHYLLPRLTQGMADAGEITTALLDAVGTDDEITVMKEAVAELITDQAYLGRQILDIGVQRGLLTVQNHTTEDGKSQLLLRDKEGNFIPMDLEGSRTIRTWKGLRLLGLACGMEFTVNKFPGALASLWDMHAKRRL